MSWRYWTNSSIVAGFLVFALVFHKWAVPITSLKDVMVVVVWPACGRRTENYVFGSRLKPRALSSSSWRSVFLWNVVTNSVDHSSHVCSMSCRLSYHSLATSASLLRSKWPVVGSAHAYVDFRRWIDSVHPVFDCNFYWVENGDFLRILGSMGCNNSIGVISGGWTELVRRCCSRLPDGSDPIGIIAEGSGGNRSETSWGLLPYFTHVFLEKEVKYTLYWERNSSRN